MPWFDSRAHAKKKNKTTFNRAVHTISVKHDKNGMVMKDVRRSRWHLGNEPANYGSLNRPCVFHLDMRGKKVTVTMLLLCSNPHMSQFGCSSAENVADNSNFFIYFFFYLYNHAPCLGKQFNQIYFEINWCYVNFYTPPNSDLLVTMLQLFH